MADQPNYSTAFGTYKPEQFSTNVDNGLNLNKKLYEMTQARNLDNAIKESLSPDGDLLEPIFYANAKKYGLNADQIRKAQEYRQFQVTSSAEIMQKRKELEAQGVDPDAMGRGTAPVQEAPKEPLTWTSIWKSLRGEVAPKAESRNTNYMGSDLPLKMASEVAPVQETFSSAAPANQTQPSELPPEQMAVPGQVDGSVNVIGSGFVPKKGSFEEDPNILNGYGNKPVIPVDNRSYREKLEDSYDASKDIYKQQPKKSAAPANRFDFNAKDDGDKYQQFKAAAEQLIVASGQASSVPEHLSNVYNAAAGALTPTPPNPALRFQGPEGMAKYKAEQLKYEADLDKQDAAGMAAVIAEKKRIAEYAQTVGGNKAAQTSQNLALQQRSWEVGGRKAVEDLGFDPNKVSPEQARDLDARRTLLTETKTLAAASKDDLMGKNGSEAQYAAIVPLMNALARIENAGTLGGQAKLETTFSNINPSIGQAFKEEGVPGALKAMRALMATDQVSGYESLIKMLDDSEKHGQLYSDLNAAKKRSATKEDVAKALGIKTATKNKYKDGDTKVNSAGEKMIYRNGKWSMQ